MQKGTFHRPALRSSYLSSPCLIFLILLAIAQYAHAQPVKILPLGNSWTEGVNHHVSYRYDLWFGLIDAGFDVDFVGIKNDTFDDLNLDLYPKYLTEFDRDHQGTAGIRSDVLVGIARAESARHQPDIVLLWTGGPDLAGQGGLVNATFSIPDIIEGIRNFVPGVTILLAQNPPRDGPGAEFIELLNDVIATIASDLDTPESPIILIDHYTGYDIDSMTQVDRIHQNRVGEAWVAENWFEVLADILPAFESFQINAGLNGSWWGGPARAGEGAQIEVSAGAEGSLIVVATVYSYDTMGNQIFMIAVGTVNGNTVEVDVFITEDGLWGDFFDPMLVLETQWGSGTFTANSCESLHMELRPNAEFQVLGYTDLMYSLVRLTTPVLPCPIDNPN